MKKIITLLLICLASLMIVACEKDNSEPTITDVIAQKSNGLSSDTNNQNSVTQTNQPIIIPTQDSAVVSTETPTCSPTKSPSLAPTSTITLTPIVTVKPTVVPTPIPTVTLKPTTAPSTTTAATIKPTEFPKPTTTQAPTIAPTETPIASPTPDPTGNIDFISEELLQDIETEFIKLVNAERKNFFLPELSVNEHLDKGAQIRSQEIISNRSHTRPDGSSYKTAVDRNSYYYMWIAENLCVVPYIAETFDQSGQQIAQTLFDTFKSSPGHYQNILFNAFKDCGFGIMCAIDEDTGYLNFHFCHIMATL